MTKQEIVEYLKDNMSKGVAFMFLPEEVKDWVDNNFNCISLLALQRDGKWDLVLNYDYDSYSNIVFALPDDYEPRKKTKANAKKKANKNTYQILCCWLQEFSAVTA